ncbi:hypothetical protein Vadar_009774 [Vaccinium darrowii]|uniref:Uncharacterized protein n=1 Tax=Vaccinium darrowii TaxID=229202 RepID=A0ACB7YU03_9ERIC|nr:hypothetical protein Vadar_009774 [Vaccinium darrowii]
MSHPKSYILILALALMAMHDSPVESRILLAQGVVSIVNYIPDTMLTIHCQSSSSKDLGTKSIPMTGEFAWDVSLVVGEKQGIYNCDLRAEGLHGRFSLFDAGRDWNRDRCGFLKNFVCAWRVRREGIYLFELKRKDYVLEYSW